MGTLVSKVTPGADKGTRRPLDDLVQTEGKQTSGSTVLCGTCWEGQSQLKVSSSESQVPRVPGLALCPAHRDKALPYRAKATGEGGLVMIGGNTPLHSATPASVNSPRTT